MSRVAIVVAILVGILVAGLVALLLVLDNPAIYKDRLSKAFLTQTGLELQINGEVNWRYLPPIAINVSDVVVSNPHFDLPLAKLGTASIDLKLIPLIFGGNVEVDGLLVEKLELNAQVDTNGKGNWETEALADASTAEQTASEPSGDDAPLNVALSSLVIRQANIHYVDLAANTDYALAIEQIKTGALTRDKPTPFDAKLQVEDRAAKMRADLTLQGNLSVSSTLARVTFNNFTVTADATLPDMPPLPIEATLNGEIDTDAGTANFDNTRLAVAGMELDLQVQANNILDVPGLRGKITSKRFNAKKLSTALGIDLGSTANAKAFSAVEFSADLSGTTDEIVFSSLTAKLDQTSINGQLTATLTPKLNAAFLLNLDKINASDYLEATVEAPASGTGDQSVAVTIPDSEVIPVDTLAETGMDGTVTIAELQYDTYNLENFQLKIKNANGNLKAGITASAYSGNLSMDVALANLIPGLTPTGTSTIKVAGINLTQVLEFDSVTGALGLTANHTFRGSLMSEVLASLDGNSEFSILDGTLDVRPVKQVAVIIDGIQGKTSSVAEWPDDLPFKQLLGQHRVNKGIAADQRFNLGIENMNVAGKGGVDYFSNQMNYDVEVTLLENVGGQFTVNKSLANIRWPLHCEGSLDADPVSLCFPDSGAITKLLKDVATQELKRKGKEKVMDAIEDKIPEDLKDGAKNLLKGLFKN